MRYKTADSGQCFGPLRLALAFCGCCRAEHERDLALSTAEELQVSYEEFQRKARDKIRRVGWVSILINDHLQLHKSEISVHCFHPFYWFTFNTM